MFKQWLTPFWDAAKNTSLLPHIKQLEQIVNNKLELINQGDLHKWIAAYNKLPDLNTINTMAINGEVSVEIDEGHTDSTDIELQNILMELHPWRKGPFRIGSCHIDSEWQSNLKWNRLCKQLPELKHKAVLDIGCGNGYYLMKMAEHSPQLTLGIEPGLLQNVQFWSVEKYADTKSFILPLKIQDMPYDMSCFDVVFSMGVLYHRKSPIEHIEHIKSMLSKGGTLILETLVVSGDSQTCLVPGDRYAQMRNVWFLPSVELLKLWLKKVGFKNIEVIDESFTDVNEQRSTEWMRFHSLEKFLSQDQSETIEGYPPPKRAILSCQK